MDMMVFCVRGELHIRRGPEATEVPEGETDRKPHFGSHDDKTTVPSEQADDEYQRPSRLKAMYVSVNKQIHYEALVVDRMGSLSLHICT